MATLADLSSANPQSPDEATLAGLSPAARAKYKAQLPEILRASRAAANARGMFYSGDAVDAETRAQEALLAELAGKDMSAETSAEEASKQRAFDKSQNDKATSVSNRNAMLGLVGSGVGSTATLGALAYMNKGNGLQNVFYVDGKPVLFDPKSGTYTPISAATPNVGGAALAGPGTAAVTPAAGIGYGGPMAAAPGASTGLSSLPGMTPGSLGIPSSGTPFVPGAGPGYAGPAAAGGAAGAAGASISQPSMWTKATSGKSLAGGAVGGLAGLAALRAAGVNGTNSDIGAGLGGLGAYGLYSKFGSGNPYLAGASALAGTFGGGLLGNLFK